jgi:hypothetical protein
LHIQFVDDPPFDFLTPKPRTLHAILWLPKILALRDDGRN